MRAGQSTVYLYAVIFVIALLIRLFTAWNAIAVPERLSRPDSSGYLTPAYSLAESGCYSSTLRPPGFPVLAALIFRLGGDERTLAVILVFFSAATTAVIAGAGYICGGHPAGIGASLLYALNPTAIGNAPLLLSDTLFGLVAALQFLFFMRFLKQRKRYCYFSCIAAAAAGTLIRPVNLLWIIPATVLLCFIPSLDCRRKLFYAAGGILLFLLIVTPWMFRNAANGAGFCIDTNSGAMYHQNGAMLRSALSGSSYEDEKQAILTEQKLVFSDSIRFPDEKSRELYRIGRYRELVLNNFPLWLSQQLDWRVLLPDAPAVMECFGVSSAGRGTLQVMKEEGVLRAVRHYFGKNYLKLLLLLSPLLLAVLILYAGALFKVAADLFMIRSRWYDLLIFLVFAEYYLILPGAITVPRYQIPALPCMCVWAALALIGIYRRFFRGKGNEAPSTGLL